MQLSTERYLLGAIGDGILPDIRSNTKELKIIDLYTQTLKAWYLQLHHITFLCSNDEKDLRAVESKIDDIDNLYMKNVYHDRSRPIEEIEAEYRNILAREIYAFKSDGYSLKPKTYTLKTSKSDEASSGEGGSGFPAGESASH